MPTLIVYGTADQVNFLSYAPATNDAVPHERKKLYAIIGGTHYLQGQTKQIAELADTMLDWLDQHGLRG